MNNEYTYYSLATSKNHSYCINKVVDEDISRCEIEKRIKKIVKEFKIDAFNLENTRIGWVGENGIEMHDAIKLLWQQPLFHEDIRVICYAINKAFEGAQCCLDVDGMSELVFIGHTKPKKDE